MNPPRPAAEDGAIRAAAARWAVRRDRGLSAAESIEFELWLAADPRRGAALQRAGRAWSRLDRVPEAEAERHLADASRRRARRRVRFALGSLAAAAGLALAAIGWWQRPAHRAPPVATLVATGPRAVALADGSLVRLNAGGEIAEEFTAAERRVRLIRGEAHFIVAKQPARPFVVRAGALRLRAVGTAFNVNLQSARIEVLVTEGRVGIERADSGAPAAPATAEPLHLDAGDRAVAPAAAREAAAAITVTRLDEAAVVRALAWQDALLRLGGATLAEIAAEFGRRTGHRVSIPDAELAALRVGGRFRADDPEGFAQLLAATFDISAERAADGTLVLRKK